jgi:hypothetical protein
MISTGFATRAIKLATGHAGTSRSAFSVSSPVKLLQSPQRARLISQTTSISLSRREVLVQLTSDVDGLGFTDDRVFVSPGRARNQLIPGRVARFVPWKKASDREPRAVPVSPPSRHLSPHHCLLCLIKAAYTHITARRDRRPHSKH